MSSTSNACFSHTHIQKPLGFSHPGTEQILKNQWIEQESLLDYIAPPSRSLRIGDATYVVTFTQLHARKFQRCYWEAPPPHDLITVDPLVVPYEVIK